MDCTDSKKLIKQLKYYGITYAAGDNLGREIDGSDKMMLDAATAIETLLAERDAAVRDLTEVCEDNPDVCHLCKHLPCVDKNGKGYCLGWQWRGPRPLTASGRGR